MRGGSAVERGGFRFVLTTRGRRRRVQAAAALARLRLARPGLPATASRVAGARAWSSVPPACASSASRSASKAAEPWPRRHTSKVSTGAMSATAWIDIAAAIGEPSSTLRGAIATPRAGRHAGQDRVVGTQFEHARGLAFGGRVPALDITAVGAAALEGHQGRHAQVARGDDARMAARRDQRQRLVIDAHLLEHGRVEQLGLRRRGEQGGVELEIADLLDQPPGHARHQFQADLGPALVITREHLGQARRGRALHGAEPQPPVRMVLAHRVPRLVGQRQQALGIGQQGLAGRGQHQAAAVAREQRGAERRLQLPDAGGHVRLHAVELGRRARDAVFAHHGAEDRQCRQIHDSLLENELLLDYSFFEIKRAG